MTSKIIFISPDGKLASRAKQLIRQTDEPINVFQGSLFKGVLLAEDLIAKGANVVISRGGTGTLIRNTLGVPVIQVKISGYDIMQSIIQASNLSNNIGVVGFENLVSGVNRMKNIIDNNVPVNIFTEMVTKEDQVNEKITLLYNKGVRVFVGGISVIQEVSAKLGCETVLLESSAESIADAIREAKEVLDVQMKEIEKTELLKSIIDFAYDGIIGINASGKITVFNPIAEEIIGCPAENALGKPVDEIVENSRMLHVLQTGVPEKEEFQKIRDTFIATNRIPIVVNKEIVGVVATFQEVDRIQNIETKIRKKLYLKGHVAKARFGDIIGNSQVINKIKDRAFQYAKVNSTILILGETGTGKELFTQSIHNESDRAEKPFVAVNCAALPATLLESELFGYVEGAFTGARKKGKAGLFELAHGGTIFLDEISEMPFNLQASLLRVLQEKEIIRIGDDKVIPIDVRVIAASNKNLHDLVEKSLFREDLYYRLCVLQIRIPPLRERFEDIAELARYFIDKKARELGKTRVRLSDAAIDKLINYSWPGNVRYLENVIERAVVLTSSPIICEQIILEAIQGPGCKEQFDNSNIAIYLNRSTDNPGVLKNFENNMIMKALEETNGNKAAAAKKLGISTTTLWRRLKKIEK